MVGWVCLKREALKKSLLLMGIIVLMQVYSNTD